jgi:hypothetical protein
MSTIDRRKFLRALGVGGAIVPTLWDRTVSANDALPKRVIFVTWSNGCALEHFWPSGGERDFVLGRELAPLEPFRKKLTIVGGLSFRAQREMTGFARKPGDYDGHAAYPGILTAVRYGDYPTNEAVCRAGGPSLDQVIARDLEARAKLPFKSLVLGARTRSGPLHTISYDGQGSAGITPENDPIRLFDALFAGRNLGNAELEKLRARRKSVLDLLGKEYGAFGERLGTVDRRTIEQHATALRDLEKRLAPGTTCSSPTKPTGDFGSNDRFPDCIQAFNRLAVTALRCDLTRVVTMTWGDAYGSGTVFSWLGKDFVGPGSEFPNRDHHDIAHRCNDSPASMDRYVAVNRWFWSQVADLAKLLEDSPEGTGTMLDRTLIVVTNQMSTNHLILGVPFVLIGNLGGALSTGRLVKLGDWAGKTGTYWKSPANVAHNRILVTIARAMGLPIESFGDPGRGGPLTELHA